ncbi:MAG: hypothetical protein GC151_13690 [Betaproteobacteria bacterium]|nr:hypothetical protein [Betaproteobacteria bacterium]
MRSIGELVQRVGNRLAVQKGHATKKEIGEDLPRGGPHAKESVIHRLDALREERKRLRDALQARKEQVASIDTELEALRDRRIKSLPYAPEGEEVDHEALSALQSEIEEKLAAQRDAMDVQSRIEARLLEIETERGALRHAYDMELGHFLTAMYEEIAEEYMQKAPEVAELMHRITAVHRVMMEFRTGNSNGFRSDGMLPRCEPGNGNTLAPLYGSGMPQEAAQIREYMEEVIGQLRAAGFVGQFR